MTAPVKFGLFYFLAASGLSLIQYLIARESLWSPSIGMISAFGFAILFIVLSIKADRADEPGYTIAEGIKAGMITFGIGTLLTSVFLYVLGNLIDPSLGDQAIEASKALAEKMATSVAGMMGADEAQQAEMLSEMSAQEFPNPYGIKNLGLGWVIGLIFPGLITALVSAAILKKN